MPRAPRAQNIPGVRHVFAVASGKGGVGKSTVAVNLAAALSAQGLSVGVLDADVYGPSLPTMLGLSGQPAYEDGAIVPHEAHGLKAMSVGLLTKADDAMIWRGPMASQAITQMLGQTRWGTAETPLDVLVVDLPPGTGDVQLTLIQKTPLDGAVIVTTPQDIALLDAKKGLKMFEKVGIPVMGVVENMAWLETTCPHCDQTHKVELFGAGGGDKVANVLAERLGYDVPMLAQIPIDTTLREGGDAGTPIVASHPDHPAAQALVELAKKVDGRKRGLAGKRLDLNPS